jgi:hypothetical protein
MYRVERKGEVIVISDWKNQIVYSVPKDSYVLYKIAGAVMSTKAGDLTDEQLLQALASAVKIEL